MLSREIASLNVDVLANLVSRLPSKAKELLAEISRDRNIVFADRRQHTSRFGAALTEPLPDGFRVWLNPAHDDVVDSFIHEIGQIYTSILGYIREAIAIDGTGGNAEIALFVINSFRGPVCERNLERYGIDRSYYRKRKINGFRNFVNSIPKSGTAGFDSLSRPYGKAQLCYNYNYTKLIVGSEFGSLEPIWDNAVEIAALRRDARRIYKRAIGSEITPTRYGELQEYFIKILDLCSHVRMQD